MIIPYLPLPVLSGHMVQLLDPRNEIGYYSAKVNENHCFRLDCYSSFWLFISVRIDFSLSFSHSQTVLCFFFHVLFLGPNSGRRSRLFESPRLASHSEGVHYHESLCAAQRLS